MLLLASQSVTTLTATDTGAGDSFSVSLVPNSGNGSSFAGTSTFHDDFDYNTGDEFGATPSTSVASTINIVAILEPALIIPGTVGILIVAAMGQGTRRRAIRRRRKAA